MKKSVSIIIPNYNGRHLLESYLPSVFIAIKHAAVEFEIIIIDDCSKDDSVYFLKSNYPEVTVLINKVNSGFSYTCNQGIKIAKMELTLLLNSDVLLTKEYFADQWTYFQYDDTFGVMGKIMNRTGKHIEDAARILFFQGCRIKANRFYYIEEGEKVYTAYLSGANALINTQKLRELEGFDEIYSPFTSEDSDLCTRAWLVGWKCYYEHRSVCYHQVSGSIRKQIPSDFIKKIYFRNRFIFHSIHLSGLRANLWPTYIILIEIIPKLIIGKIFILESFRAYYKAFSQIRKSKERLNLLKARHNSTLEVHDIIKIIEQSIKEKSIIKL